MKDARAVTRQWMSIEHVDPARVQALEISRLRVLSVTRHHNKLRLGHLKGNRFVIRVRGTQTDVSFSTDVSAPGVVMVDFSSPR